MNTPQEAAFLISELVKEKGITISKMLQECGLAKKVIDNMKTGSMPSADKLGTIASYLGVSTDYLLGLTDNPLLPETPAISTEDIATLKDLKELSKEDKELVKTIIRMRKQQEAGALKND